MVEPSNTRTEICQYPPLIDYLLSLQPSTRRGLNRHLCRTDLYYLLRYALNRPDLEKRWLFDRCLEVQESPNGYLDLWAREHYKSTIITFALTIQDILASHGESPLEKWAGREPTFGIFSHNRPNAKGFLKQIKRELETNEFLKDLFPDVLYQDPGRESPKWSEDDGLIVKRRSNPKESTVEAWGLVDGQPTGKHFVVRIYDDVVTEGSITTPEMVKKTTDAWAMSVNLGTEGGVERHIGTRYSDGDTYDEILNRKAAIPRIYTATDNGTAAGNPVLVSREYLEKKRTAMGPYIFSCQMLQNPIRDENAFFRVQDLKRFNLKDLPEQINVYGASDYAVTLNDGDFTEHGIVGVDENEDLWVFDWWSGQKTADIWIDAQLDLVKAREPHVWVGEKGVIQKAIEPYLKKRMDQRRIYVRQEWIARTRDKASMARAFQALASAGKVHILDCAWGDDLVMELGRFPYGLHDDKADVCALFGLMLSETWAAPPLKADAPPPETDAWGRRHAGGDGWRTQ